MHRTRLHFCSLLIAAALAFAACTPNEEPETGFDFSNSCWFDGYEFFVATADTLGNDPDVILFSGGNLHESGSTFALRRIAIDTFLIQPIPGETWTAVGIEGDTAVVKNDGSKTMLICFRPDDPEADTLTMFDATGRKPIEVYEELLIAKRLNDLRGTYLDTKKSITYQFADTLLIRTDSKGIADTQSFSFFYEFDMPSHTLVISEKEQIWYEITPDGMDLFKVKYWPREEGYSREARFAKLIRQE